ncbi:TPA: FAD-dependent oxidoreductase [Burkholderia vietnamiensis]|uniref:FAD-dependent oxidoreductase n=1 Tax=Burkholderia vietnamiensis TaxID=60552 RepID=UPI001B98EED4|nr:FAD-dependent oxidoreductase [Burkholderia vietnamiensis]MBR7908853.1 FAD-dependent oxidoreductase [Burkholderia vietnamiensis]HDR9273387.1 FAD-dependent oxidoreductase [Burkholderia vietnamiensis]
MTSSLQRILVIGGGFAGMTTAIQCAKLGLSVDLVEIDTGWRSYGAGISIGGPTLRALRTVGVLDAFFEHGHGGDGVNLFTAAGHPIGTLPTPRVAGDDVPGGGAIMRPALAGILADATRAAGVHVRLGCTFSQIAQRDDGVDVTFTDGTHGRYDLVVGADGLYSKVRDAVFPDAPKPHYTGQGVWRAVVPRPAEIVCATMWLGQKVKAGVNPVSQEEMYVFVTEDRPTNERIDPAHWPRMLADLLASFGAPLVQSIRAQVGPHSHCIYRPLESLLLLQPWFDARVVLVGDAVHATTPHMAAGAGIGIEDGIVLAEELGRGATVQAALQAFQARRWERCRMVVENSGRLGEIEISGGDKAEHTRIMHETHQRLAQQI